jgi:dienelactone hydrolase
VKYFLGGQTSVDQGRRTSLKTEIIEYELDGLTFEGYAAYDEAKAPPAPCVLVAHDWSGQSESTRALTRRLAEHGYVGFALDAYGKGRRGSPSGDNSALMNPLMEDRSLLQRRLLAAVAAARNHARVNTERIGVIGHCFGGLCALDLARISAPGLRCAVSFHGALTPPAVKHGSIESSILVMHGWEDPVAPPAAVHALADELTAAGADWQIHIYGHAMHAFTFKGANFPERGIMYNEAADKRSWAAMRAFLSEKLKPPKSY